MTEVRKTLLSNALRANLLKRKQQKQCQQKSDLSNVVSLHPITVDKIEKSLEAECLSSKKVNIA